MQLSQPAPQRLVRLLATLWAATCASCMGTPTPEPPDDLPPLDPASIQREEREIQIVSEGPKPVPLRGAAGALSPGARVWLVNLDADVAPVEAMADADGSFAATVLATVGDRVRLVARDPERHSPPLDLQIGPEDTRSFMPAGDVSGGCLAFDPAELVVALDASPRRQPLEVQNRCAEPVQLERVRLRLGDQGMSLVTQPESVPAHGSATLTLEFAPRGPGPERGDVLLLEGVVGAERTRYAVGIWSRSGAGTGKR